MFPRDGIYMNRTAQEENIFLMFTSRILRRRWVLGVIFSCSLIYFLVRTFTKNVEWSRSDLDERPHTRIRPVFQWQQEKSVFNNNTDYAPQCRNSVQGKFLIVDELGFVCNRSALLQSGCCSTTLSSRKRFSCLTCSENACCTIYEYCVSCCLKPDKKPILRRILKQAEESSNPLFIEVKDHFELCLAKCRTSSQSVQHENSYRNSRTKHCYGDKPPDIQM